MKNYRRLSLYEWQRIFVMTAKGKEFHEIAAELKRDPYGVKKAINRYPLPWHMEEGATPYDRARYAHEQAERTKRSSKSKQRLKCKTIRDYVVEKLTDEDRRFTPELIAGRLSVDHPELSISYEAIYDWIFSEEKGLIKYLPRAGKPKRGKPGARAYPKRQPAAPKKGLDLRPIEANERLEIGHKESDLIVSAKSDANLLVVVDRKGRQVRLKKLPNRQSETVRRGLVSVLSKTPPCLRRTLTQDNGSEHALHAQLEQDVKISVYFCDPYAAWQRGTVENRNGVIRRYFPKGTDFSAVSDEDVARVERIINSTPMKILGFLTPDEFHQREEKQIFEKLKKAA